jgi:excisionase family DNA binding protein
MGILETILAKVAAMESQLAALVALSPAAPVVVGGDEWVTVKEAAAVYRVSVSHLRRLMDRGELPWTKPAKLRLIPRKALVALLNKHARNADAD